MSYCDYDTDSGESDTFCPLSMNLMCSKITLATKEQRELLFSKMKDAGYEFNFEKKELNKIEQKFTIMTLDEAIKHCEEKSCGNDACSLEHKQLKKWLTELKELKKQKSTEWSEEEIENAAQEWDSKANFNLFYMTMDGDKPTGVKQDITTHKESFKAGVNWILKSLRLQKQWKPSKEQIVALRWILNNIPFNKHKEEISGLLDQIKDL